MAQVPTGAAVHRISLYVPCFLDLHEAGLRKGTPPRALIGLAASHRTDARPNRVTHPTHTPVRCWHFIQKPKSTRHRLLFIARRNTSVILPLP